MIANSLIRSTLVTHTLRRAVGSASIVLVCAALALGALSSAASAQTTKPVKLYPPAQDPWSPNLDPPGPNSPGMPIKQFFDYSKTSSVVNGWLRKPCLNEADRKKLLASLKDWIEYLLKYQQTSFNPDAKQEAGDYASLLNAKYVELEKKPDCSKTASPGTTPADGPTAGGTPGNPTDSPKVCWSQQQDDEISRRIAANEESRKQQQALFRQLKDEALKMWEKLHPGHTLVFGVPKEKKSWTNDDWHNAQTLDNDPTTADAWAAELRRIGAHAEQVHDEIEKLTGEIEKDTAALEALQKNKCPETGKTSETDKTKVDVPGKTVKTDEPGKTPTTDVPGKTVETDKAKGSPVKKPIPPTKTGKRTDTDKQVRHEPRQPVEETSTATRERDRATAETVGTAVTVGIGIGSAFGGGRSHDRHFDGGRGLESGGGRGGFEVGGGGGFNFGSGR